MYEVRSRWNETIFPWTKGTNPWVKEAEFMFKKHALDSLSHLDYNNGKEYQIVDTVLNKE